jgi:hypothetical protein
METSGAIKPPVRRSRAEFYLNPELTCAPTPDTVDQALGIHESTRTTRHRRLRLHRFPSWNPCCATGTACACWTTCPPGYRRNLEPWGAEVEVQIGDVRDPAAVKQAVQGVSGIFHEAALVSVFDSVQAPRRQSRHQRHRHAECPPRRARGRGGARGAGQYGRRLRQRSCPAQKGIHDAQPESPYAVAKVMSEHYLRLAAQLYGVETVVLRYFNVFGPRQDPKSPYSGVISRFCDDLAAGRAPTIFGDGLQTRDFVFVNDVVQANRLAMSDRVKGAGQIYNVASGSTTSRCSTWWPPAPPGRTSVRARASRAARGRHPPLRRRH